MENILTHFKRQGSSSTLILQGLPKQLYSEGSQDGYLKLELYYEMPKTWKGKTYYETHSKIILSKNDITKGKDYFKDAEKIINKVISKFDIQIQIENYIESYYIGSQKGDRDILDNIDITDKTVLQVLAECKINLIEFFKPWKVEEKEQIKNILMKPSKGLLNQKFSDLYTFIHWYGFKGHEKFEQEFISVI